MFREKGNRLAHQSPQTGRTSGRCVCVCANARGGTWHRHVHLIGGGLAHKAREYPPPLVGAVLQALKEELLAKGELNELSAHTSGPIPEEPEMPDGLWMEAWGDVNGGYLDPVE